MDDNTGGKSADCHIKFDEDGPVVDADLIADLLDIPVDQISSQIKQGKITTLCEAGVGEHEGGYRMSFFHRNRRAQLEVDCEGRVFNRTVIDFGDRPLPASMRGPTRIISPIQRLSGNR